MDGHLKVWSHTWNLTKAHLPMLASFIIMNKKSSVISFASQLSNHYCRIIKEYSKNAKN